MLSPTVPLEFGWAESPAPSDSTEGLAPRGDPVGGGAGGRVLRELVRFLGKGVQLLVEPSRVQLPGAKRLRRGVHGGQRARTGLEDRGRQAGGFLGLASGRGAGG